MIGGIFFLGRRFFFLKIFFLNKNLFAFAFLVQSHVFSWKTQDIFEQNSDFHWEHRFLSFIFLDESLAQQFFMGFQWGVSLNHCLKWSAGYLKSHVKDLSFSWCWDSMLIAILILWQPRKLFLVWEMCMQNYGVDNVGLVQDSTHH